MGGDEWDGTVALQRHRHEEGWWETVWLDFLAGGIPWVLEVEVTWGREEDPTEDPTCRGDPGSRLLYIGPARSEEAERSNRVLGHSRVIDLGGPYPLMGWWEE